MSFSILGFRITLHINKKYKKDMVWGWDGKFEDAIIIREYRPYTDLGYF